MIFHAMNMFRLASKLRAKLQENYLQVTLIVVVTVTTEPYTGTTVQFSCLSCSSLVKLKQKHQHFFVECQILGSGWYSGIVIASEIRAFNGTGDTDMVSQVEPFTCYC